MPKEGAIEIKIRYEFVTGEIVEIEVPEEFDKVAVSIDKEVRNSDRRETRRHSSVEELEEQGRQFHDEGSNVEETIVQNEEHDLLRKAFDKLLPQQRELIRRVFLEGRTMADIAREEGVTAKAIQERINKIKSRLKKIIEKNSF